MMLLIASLMAIFICGLAGYSRGAYVCENTCNDGGCEYAKDGGGAPKECYCPIPEGWRTGKNCESYGDACAVKTVQAAPCKNDGKCVSALGFPYCDCPARYYGTKCQGFDSGSNRTYPKKPSLYYRTKVKPGERLSAGLVIEHDDNVYTLQFFNNAIGTFTYTNGKDSITIDELYSMCKDLGSKEFPVNENMCDFAKTTYGGYSKIDSLRVVPYYMSKTRSGRTDVYFDGDKSAGRMGGLYVVQAIVLDEKMKKTFFNYEFYHLVVDDESSYCLPFVDAGENCKIKHTPLKVRRNEDLPVLKMVITPDVEVCKKSDVLYVYEWRILNAGFPLNYDIDPVDKYSKKLINLDAKTSSNRDLIVRPYTLPEGVQLVHFKITIKKQKNGDFEQYSPAANRYMCFIDVQLDGLHAEIVGSPEMEVIDSESVTIDASLSYNPNEPKSRQNDVLYIWQCDVKTDRENCQEYTTTDPVRKLTAPLSMAKKYVFKLITRASNDYVERIGKPHDGTAEITLIPNALHHNFFIKCMKNCEKLSSPLEVVYLSVETNCDNCTFEWFYKEASDSKFSSTINIREAGDAVPSRVFIAMKNSLDYNKVYTFKAKDTNSELSRSVVIKTAARPLAGECQVNPTSGIAGKTLFTITCSQFRDDYGDDDLVYYYYERYENDRDDGHGILIDRGSNILRDVKLSTSGKLNVIALNAFGIRANVNITVQIFKSSAGKLRKMFKRMKIELLNGRISAAVQMSSIISDILLDNKITIGFSVLINTISKIPSKGCSFCIEQTVLALKKFVHLCSEINGGKIKSDDALAISTNLLLIVGNLFEHLLTVRNDEIVSDAERIEQIYNDVKIVIDNLIRYINPIVYMKNSSMSSTRYFWSSLQNMALVTQNIDETLKIFGESVLLHQIVHEKAKTYKSEQSNFWANMLSADMLREQSVIGYDLADELLRSNKNTVAWGLKIFEIDRNVAFWTEPTRGNPRQGVKSNVKYVALSARDRTNSKYSPESVDRLVLPATIIFDMAETVDEHDDEHTISVPAAGSEEIEFDKAVRVFRLDMTEVGAVSVTVKSPSHPLLITWTRNRRPDSGLMGDGRYVTKIPSGADDYKIAFHTRKDYQHDIHYIGIFADMTADNLSNRSYEVKFKMNMVGTRCAHWDKDGRWSSEGMEIGANGSAGGNTAAVRCTTYHLSLFSSSVFVLPDLPNPVDDIHLFSTVSDNMVCSVLVTVIFILYFVILYWSSVRDKMDILTSRATILADNYVGEDEVYLVTVYTGHGFGSGTSANVCVELNGSVRNSRAHWLHSPYYRTLQRANDDWFLIFTPRGLGELKSIHIWHDNYGTHPDWYCQRIIVTEIRTEKMWNFDVERWFSLRRPAESIEHVISIAALEYNWRRVIKEYSFAGIREKHLWASVFICHPRSPITRCQRLSIILCAILSLMLSSLMFYETRHTDEEEFEKYELKLREFVIAIQSGLIQVVLTFCVHLCFQRGRKIQLNEIAHQSILQNNLPDAVQDTKNLTKTEKIIKFVIGRMNTKRMYYPVDVEDIKERRQWNRWFIVGWTVCIVIYISTAFFIVLYGLKFGRIKSLYWLTTIVIGIFQSVVIAKPFSIILTAAIIAKYIWQPKKTSATYTYNLTLGGYRKKNLKRLQDVECVKQIRNYRRRYFYTPLTSRAVNILRERRALMTVHNNLKSDAIVCTVLILTSVCCLFVLNVFGNQNDKYQTNRVSSKYLRSIFELSSDTTRLITPNNLKKCLSFGLLKALHSPEFYNGVPLADDTIEITEPDRTGWFGLYNSRLIGGGIRIWQNRIDANGRYDDKNYGARWTEYDVGTGGNAVTPWTYSRPKTNDDDEGGYVLYLTGGLVKSKLALDEHLKSRWLDTRTRRLSVRFQIYTPNEDTVTAVNIRATTGCGISYAISVNMDTVPMSSVVAELNTYVFTAFASGSLAVTAVTCLLVSAFRRTDHGANGGGSWTPSSSAYDWLLATVAVALATVIRWRLAVMKRVTEQMTASTGYVNLAPACRMHAACVTCATVLTVAALLRLTKPRWPSSGRLYLAAAVTAVSIYYFFDRLSRDEVH